MKSIFINREKQKRIVFILGLVFVFMQVFSVEGFAQKRKPKAATKSAVKKTHSPKTKTDTAVKVTQIDAIALRNLLKRGGTNTKPLLVNFWATWCVPCLEEFPDLVKIDNDYKDKIDFIIISIDDLAEIDRDVPQFLAKMKAEMPAFLLKTQNEEAAIASVSKEWKGGMPYTVLFDEKGLIVYDRQGIVDALKLRGEIDKLLPKQTAKFAPWDKNK